ncbi:MATE family efflux transporter [Hahella sp. CCB-MM4]|uniref:MATE family efflux transporter n=1 Tax=Hahella sp. (strain CCB-MM4) TaxID=1926491 RepID=UPI000B9C707C|nr:MATE family efflux transporter [Hahella sp. CCB-MM4]OZG71012.1 MATE family efflux transporter [Hahella sp. CCB-MM4]
MNRFVEVLRLAGPLTAAQLAQTAMIFCDSILFGLLGVEELAGAGLGSGIYNFFLIVVTGLLAAVASEVAIYVGRGAMQDIARVVKAGLVLSVIVALALVGIIMLMPGMLRLMGQTEASIFYADQYLTMASLIGFPAFAFLVLRGLATGMGRTTSIMRISILAVVLNVPLSYVLMTGWGPAPAMGVPGAALGTALVSLLMCGMLAADLWRYPEVRDVLQSLRNVVLHKDDYKPFFTLGVSIALAWTMEAGLFTAATILAGTISVAALAAHQIALQTASMSFAVYIGFAQGAAIKTGQSFGRNDFANVRHYTWAGLGVGMGFCLVAAFIFLVFPEWIVSLFTLGAEGTLDSDVQSLGVQILFVAAFFQLVDGGQVIMMTALRALRVGMPPTVVTIFCYWGVGFPVAWMLMGQYGIVGVWVGLGAGLGFAALSLTIMFIRKVHELEQSTLSGTDLHIRPEPCV